MPVERPKKRRNLQLHTSIIIFNLLLMQGRINFNQILCCGLVSFIGHVIKIVSSARVSLDSQRWLLNNGARDVARGYIFKL